LSDNNKSDFLVNFLNKQDSLQTMIKNIKEVKECPECASSNVIYKEDKQQVVCRDCGMIFEPMAPEREEKFEKAAGIKK